MWHIQAWTYNPLGKTTHHWPIKNYNLRILDEKERGCKTYRSCFKTCQIGLRILNFCTPPSLIEQVEFHNFMSGIHILQLEVQKVHDVSRRCVWAKVKMANGLYDPSCTLLCCMDNFRVILSIFCMPLQKFFLSIANLHNGKIV